MRNNKIFWILVVFLVTETCQSGTQHSLTLVSTQPQDNLVKNQTETTGQSIHNYSQSLPLNTTELKKAIEQTQNSKNKQTSQQVPVDSVNSDKSNDPTVEVNKVSESNVQNTKMNENTVSNAISEEKQKQENQTQKKKQLIKNQSLSNQPKIPIQNKSSEKNNQISLQNDIKKDNLKNQQFIPNQSLSVKKETNQKINKEDLKGQIKPKTQQKQTDRIIQQEADKSKRKELQSQESKNAVLVNKKQAEQKKNNFKIDDILPAKQFQSLGNLQPVLSNMIEQKSVQSNKRQMNGTNQQNSYEQQERKTNKITSKLHQTEKTIVFNSVPPEIPIKSLNITVPKINAESVLKSAFSSQQKDKNINQRNNIKDSANQNKKTENNTQSTDSYVKWARDKALKSQAQNTATTDTNQRSENQTAKKIEQKGKVMKNPKQGPTPLIPQDKGKPKEVLQAKKQKIKQEHNIPEPSTKQPDNQKTPQSQNNTHTTDSYVKWARDKALKSQAQNTASTTTNQRSDNQTAKKIQQKGKVMKNPKQGPTPLIPEDKGKPKEVLQAKKQKIKQENNILDPTKKSTDSYVKQARDKSLGTQNQNKQIVKKTQTQQAKKIEQKGKVMKNPKQGPTPLIPEDKAKPKEQIQAKKQKIKQENNIPDPTKHQTQLPNQSKIDSSTKKIQPQSSKMIQQNQMNESHRTGKRGKNSARNQQQIQRMKELIKKRKEKKDKNRQIINNAKNNNLKQQLLLNKLQSFKEQRNKDRQIGQKKTNLFDKQTHLTHQSPLDTKNYDKNLQSKSQLQNKQQNFIYNQKQQTEKTIKQNRYPKVHKKQNDSTSQIISQVTIYLVLIAIALGIYFYSNRKKQPVQQIKSSQARLRDSEEDEIEIAQRAEEEG